MSDISVRALTSTRIPTVDGEFRLRLYENNQDDKDHLALVYGDVQGASDVLVRIHSECFTGDVLGSLRCDCGEQLDASMRKVATHGTGIILYLRQEGRGIGLLDKLRAYELQDEGFDTVEANLLLGHGADERDYTIGARILDDMGIDSVRLLTNNPEKIESLEQQGITVTERVPLPPHVHQHNTEYLQTKVERMRHLLELGPSNGIRSNRHEMGLFALRERAHRHFQKTGRPFVTLAYAQSLDGSFDEQWSMDEEVQGVKHRLQALHDAIVVDVDTANSDDSDLSIRRRARRRDPRFIVLDPQLQFSPDTSPHHEEDTEPIIACGQAAFGTERKKVLEEQGAEVIRLSQSAPGELDVDNLLSILANRGIQSLIVEGGTGLITRFLSNQTVDHLVIAMSPRFIGGKPAIQPSLSTDESASYPQLEQITSRWVGGNLVLRADPIWHEKSQ